MAPTSPRPGTAVRGSSTGRPIMAALDLLGRRWSLRILWELRAEALGARELRTRCDEMSSSVLYTRLNELKDAKIVEQQPDGAYTLTSSGTSLYAALQPLLAWADDWAVVD